MPGATSGLAGTGGGTMRSTAGSVAVGRTAQERILAAGLAREGEGEEVVVGELAESEGVGSTLSGGRKTSVLEDNDDKDRMKFGGGGSMLDDEQDVVVAPAGSDAATYDSDSSGDLIGKDGIPFDDRKQKLTSWSAQAQSKERIKAASLQPRCLPFPPPVRPGGGPHPMYTCQEEEDTTDTNIDINTASYPPPTSSLSSTNVNGDTKMSLKDKTDNDHLFRPPFLDPSRATPLQMDEERRSWMMFKFPTRLPRISTTGSGNGAGSSGINGVDGDGDGNGNGNDGGGGGGDEYAMDVDDDNNAATNDGGPTTTGTTSAGYDDTLEYASTQTLRGGDNGGGGGGMKYGTIRVHKSGRATLDTVGGVRMLLDEGLSRGFLQQAVSIDVGDAASYAYLGDVGKTLVVTPDVERAFSMARS